VVVIIGGTEIRVKGGKSKLKDDGRKRDATNSDHLIYKFLTTQGQPSAIFIGNHNSLGHAMTFNGGATD
jgi:hypothetical protein